MNPIEIPLTTTLGKSVLVSLSVSLVICALYWVFPRFKTFIREALQPRSEGLSKIRIVWGLLVYIFIFSIIGIVGVTGLAVAGAQPARISEAGISGSSVACDRGVGVIAISCSVPLSRLRIAPNEIRWNEINSVDCTSRIDGSIREVRVTAEVKRIEITSLIYRDLSGPLEIIRSRAPKRALQHCRLDTGN